jgi:hypothetical protein
MIAAISKANTAAAIPTITPSGNPRMFRESLGSGVVVGPGFAVGSGTGSGCVVPGAGVSGAAVVVSDCGV